MPDYAKPLANNILLYCREKNKSTFRSRSQRDFINKRFETNFNLYEFGIAVRLLLSEGRLKKISSYRYQVVSTREIN